MAILQDARHSSNAKMLTERMREYDDELERYIPVLMAQAHMYWGLGQHSNVLSVLQQNREFAGDHETWKLNLAHTYFMLVRRVCS
jgi:tetratricopeptide repeat protein 30